MALFTDWAGKCDQCPRCQGASSVVDGDQSAVFGITLRDGSRPVLYLQWTVAHACQSWPGQQHIPGSGTAWAACEQDSRIAGPFQVHNDMLGAQ